MVGSLWFGWVPSSYNCTTGIDEEMAEKILSDFYRGEDEEAGEASPLKVRWLLEGNFLCKEYLFWVLSGYDSVNADRLELKKTLKGMWLLIEKEEAIENHLKIFPGMKWKHIEPQRKPAPINRSNTVVVRSCVFSHREIDYLLKNYLRWPEYELPFVLFEQYIVSYFST